MPAFLHYHELLWELTKRELKQRYKQSVLGYAWVILNPLFQMLVMAFVFSRVLRVSDLEVPYAVFLYAGLLPWTLMSASLQSSVNSLVSSSGLLTKIYFPRVILVQSTILAKIIDFLLASSVFVIFLAVSQIPITWQALWIFPIFAAQSIFTYALSLVVAAGNLFYRDVQYLLSLVLMIWMYITPVIFPTTLFPEQYQWLFTVNPMAVFLTGYRQALFTSEGPNLLALASATVLSVVLYVLARAIFKRLEGSFADVV